MQETEVWKDKFERQLEAALPKYNLSEANRTLLDQYYNTQYAKGRSPKTLLKTLFCFKSIFEYWDPKLPFKDATRQDIEKLMARVNTSGYAEATKCNIRITVKQFYKDTIGEGEFYPRPVSWIKTTLERKKKMLPESLLSEEDVQKMIETAKNFRDKLIISLLWDTGIRAGELLSMRIKDVEINNEVSHIRVNGKTGNRRIPAIPSMPYLVSYLNMLKDLKPEDPLWWNLARSRRQGQLTIAGLQAMLNDIGNSAGIKKHVYPHLFRHSRATFLANRMTEQQLKVYFGWTGASRMTEIYCHVSGKDIDNAALVANGLKPIEITKPIITNKICERCRAANGADSTYCTKCGYLLDKKLLNPQDKEVIYESQKDLIDQAIESYLGDEDNFKRAIERVSSKLLKEDYKRKTRSRREIKAQNVARY